VQVKISGYAASGGGRGIERVDVSVDGGKTWMEASRSQKRGIQYISDAANSDKWAWVLFEVTADIQHSTEIIAKAVCFIFSSNYHYSSFLSYETVEIFGERKYDGLAFGNHIRT